MPVTEVLPKSSGIRSGWRYSRAVRNLSREVTLVWLNRRFIARLDRHARGVPSLGVLKRFRDLGRWRAWRATSPSRQLEPGLRGPFARSIRTRRRHELSRRSGTGP